MLVELKLRVKSGPVWFSSAGVLAELDNIMIIETLLTEQVL